MGAPRVLFVKLSSLGDVVHHLPALTDFARHHPQAHVGWAVEDAYLELVRLHPALAEAFPVNLRGLRRAPWSGAQWGSLVQTRRSLRNEPWDYVIDTQGLLKSGLVASCARGPRFGFDRSSARERLASRCYDVGIAVARGQHAVRRNRELVAAVFGYAIDDGVDYGLQPPAAPPAWAPQVPYLVMLHAASRAEKTWPAARWVELGRRLADHGYALVLPGGNARERAAGAKIAAQVPNASAAPATSLGEMAALIGHAWATVGVDTGLTHLSVALGRPTVGIYCATSPALTGLNGRNAVSLGTRGAAPSVESVAQALGA